MAKISPLRYAVLLIVFVASTALVLLLIQQVWTTQGVIPQKFLASGHMELALRLATLAALPMVLMIFVVMIFRVFTPACDPINGEESDIFRINKNVLQNTLEQTFLFVMGLWAVASWEQIHKEALVLLTLFYVATRLAFWIGYLFGVFRVMTILRGPGMVGSLLVNLSLIVYNASHLAVSMNILAKPLI